MTAIYHLVCDALPGETRVLAFKGEEAISQPYSFEVHVAIPVDASLSLDHAAVIGQRATLQVMRDDGTPRTAWHGVLATFEVVHDLTNDSLYRAVIVPKLWELGLTLHSNVFVNQRIPDIIRGVLEDSGLAGDDFTLRLSKTYRPVLHVCQYKESNLAFVARWMEREGMYYFFEHDGAKEKLVITDDASLQTALDETPARYFPGVGHDTSGVEAVGRFVCRHEMKPASVTFKDYDYLAPSSDASGTSAALANGAGEVYVYGDNTPSAWESKRLAKIHAEELIAASVRYEAAGRIFHARSGYFLELDEHPRATFNTRYLVVSARHRGINVAPGAAELRHLGVEDDEVYHIDFTSIEAAKQYRAPRRTPWPRIWGMETAVIDGSLDSEYAQIDEHGRYFVKILFDETDLRNGRASTRVRMLQPHGGSTEGFHFPLRKGTEVTLAFLGGDPDRPVIAAVAPNAERVSPVTEGNHTLNVLQTGGSNRLEIEDSNGAQYIKWHTPHEDTMFHLGSKHNPKFHVWLKTLGDCGFHYGTDWEVKVGGWHHEDVTGEVVQHYKNGQKTTVDAAIRESYFNAAHRQEIKGGEDLIVHDGGRRDTVTGDVVETYKNKMKTEVTGLREEVYHASQTVDVTGTMTETVSGAVDETYGSWKATSKGTTDIISKAGAMTVDATGQKFSLLANQKEETITADENKKILGGRMTMASADRKIVLGDVAIDIFVGLKMEAALAVALSMFVGLKYEGSFAIRLEDHKLEAKSGIAAMKTIATEVKAIASIIKNGGIDIDLTGMNLM